MSFSLRDWSGMQLLPYDQCREIERTHVCARCGSLLKTSWVGSENSYAVVCGSDPAHQGFQRMMSYTQRYKAGMPIPLEVEIQFQRKEDARMKEDREKDWVDEAIEESEQAALNAGKKEKGKTPMRTFLPQADFGDGKALTRDEVTTLLEMGHALQLDPYLSHIVIYYHRPYVTEAGMLYHAHRSGEFDGMESFPLSPAERGDAKIADDEHAWKAWVWRKGFTRPFTGLGRAKEDPKSPIAKGSFVEHLHPQRMAEVRAENQALRKAFPIGLPILGEEEEGQEEQK